MKTAEYERGAEAACLRTGEGPCGTRPCQDQAITEFLILPDGRLMVHNLTPTMAALLSELNPEDEMMSQRAGPELRIT